MFTSSTLSWVIAGISGVLGIVFIFGKGRPVLDLFSSARDKEREKKRTPEQELGYQRALAVFLLVLCANETIMALFADTVRWIPIMTMSVVLLTLVLVAIYIRKKT